MKNTSNNTEPILRQKSRNLGTVISSLQTECARQIATSLGPDGHKYLQRLMKYWDNKANCCEATADVAERASHLVQLIRNELAGWTFDKAENSSEDDRSSALHEGIANALIAYLIEVAFRNPNERKPIDSSLEMKSGSYGKIHIIDPEVLAFIEIYGKRFPERKIDASRIVESAKISWQIYKTGIPEMGFLNPRSEFKNR